MPDPFVRGTPIPGYYWDPKAKEYKLDTAGMSRWDAFWADQMDVGKRSPIGAKRLEDPNGEQLAFDKIGAFFNQPAGTPLSQVGAGKAPEATPGPMASGWEFSPNGGAPAARPTGGGPQALIQTLFPGAKPTSGDRSAEHNAEVGGVANSYHLRKGQAVDFIPPKGLTIGQAKASLIAQGYDVAEALDEGDHFHIAFKTPPGQTTTMPGAAGLMQSMTYVTPEQAMGYVPDPVLMGKVDLPAAPKLKDMPDRPMYDEVDVNEMLGPMRVALQPTEDGYGKSEDDLKKEGLLSFLQGGVQALAGANPEMSIPQLVALWAGGGIAKLDAKKAEQKMDKKEKDRLTREGNLLLAQMEWQIKSQNHGIRQGNKDIGWGNQSEDVAVDNQNVVLADQRNVQEVGMNVGIEQGNVQTRNQFGLARGQAGLGAAQQGAETQNRATIAQVQMDENARLAEGNGMAQVQKKQGEILSSVGLVTPNTKDPIHMNAVEGAGAVAANNPTMAIDKLAKESLLNGSAGNLLAPQKNDSADVKVAKAEAMRKIADANKKQDLAGAQAALNAFLTAHPDQVQLLTQSSNGPVAQMFKQYGNRKTQ